MSDSSSGKDADPSPPPGCSSVGAPGPVTPSTSRGAESSCCAAIPYPGPWTGREEPYVGGEGRKVRFASYS